MARLSRREALSLIGKGAVAAGALALGADLRPVQAGWIVPDRGAGVRAGTWHLPGPELRKGELLGLAFDARKGALRPAQSGGGVYLSPVLRAQHAFQALGLQWDGRGKARFEVRVSGDGRRWSEWTHLHDSHIGGPDGATATDLAFLSGRYLQFRAAFPAGLSSLLLSGVRAVYIDASEGPTLADVMAARSERVVGVHSTGAVDIITRAEWGANEGYRFRDGEEWWWPEYVPVEKAIIHHSVTSNSQDPVQAVRSIYYFHAMSNDWGDIGYNYLVDRYGNVYEGRFGGGHIVGGHARQFNYGSMGVCAIGNFHPPAGGTYPSSAMLNGIVRIVARRLRSYGVNPTGSSTFQPLPDRPAAPDLPNICGHRDVAKYTVDGGTSCPGDALYQYLPSIRVWVRDAAVPQYAAQFLSQTTPDRVVKGASVGITVQVKNVGTATWASGGSNPVKLEYQWYRITDGRTIKNGRIALPRNVAPGETVDVSGGVVAPNVDGEVGLRWEAVHEGVAAFATHEGDVTYDMRVQMESFRATPASLMIPAGRAQGPASRIVQAQGAVAWTATSSQAWLTVSPASAAGSTDVTLTVDPDALLTNGTYTGTVTFKNGDLTLGTVNVTAVVWDDINSDSAGGVSR